MIFSGKSKHNPAGAPTPDVLVFAKTAQHYNGKSAKDLASQVRILHPDAVVVMPDLSLRPYQSFRLQEHYLAGVGTIPICALNPSELTPDGIQKVLDSGFYRHQYQALLRDTHQDDEDPKAEQYDDMVRQLKEKGLNKIVQEGQSVIQTLHQMYPPSLYKLEKFIDLVHSDKYCVASLLVFLMQQKLLLFLNRWSRLPLHHSARLMMATPRH